MAVETLSKTKAPSAVPATMDFNWKTAGRIGFIGGILAVLVSVIGMVETFDGRDIIGGVISMGQTVVVALIFATAFMAADRSSKTRPLFHILGGGLSGLISAVMLALFVWVSQLVNLREIFVNVSPSLIAILTFDKELPAELSAAVIQLLLTGLVLGLVAGVLRAAPIKIRNIIFSGMLWVVAIGLLGELIRTLVTGRAIEDQVAWVLGGRLEKGLSVNGAVSIFIFASLLSFISQTFGARIGKEVQTRRAALPATTQRILNGVILLVVFLVLWQLPQYLGLYLSDVANTVGLYILMGLGLNIVVGFAGLLDLGYVAFFAIGAYVMGVATSSAVGDGRGQILFSLNWTFWEALPLAILVALFAGILLGIPVLKMRGDYLAIVTLGFGEIIRIMALSDYLKPNIGGAQGIVGIQPIILAGQNLSNPISLFHVVLIACVIVGFVAWRLRDSRVGRAWKAIREDEDVAAAMGINLVSTKLLAFGAGAAFSGLAGAIFASKLTSIQPGSFSFIVSINILALIIIGGMGSIPGVIVGALALVALPELLREFAEFRLLVYGVVLVMMMLYKPEGLLPEETHKAELHEDENIPAESHA
jgi:branched-chain amino acid transport system permease protein